MSSETWTVAMALKWMQARFLERGIDSARLDAELLLAATLGCDRLGVFTRAEQPLNDDERARLRDYVKKRQAREPVAYILGRKGFGDVDLQVGPGVLVPRPETEFVLDVCRELETQLPSGACADFGTGSGALAIGLKRLWPNRHVIAIERSPAALVYAQANIAALAPDIELRQASWCEGLAEQSLALAVSNPPYVAETARGSLAAELGYEPAEALFSGHDGLDDIRHLADRLRTMLVPGGWWICEVGSGQRAAIAALLQDMGWQDVRWSQDYGGIDRVFAAKIMT